MRHANCSEAFLAQAQRLTKTGSAWWKPTTGEIVWSDENYRILEYPIGVTPTLDMALNRCHPDDTRVVQDALAAAIRDGTVVDLEHRLLMPNGDVKYVRVFFQNVAPEHQEPEYVGATSDITTWKLSEEKLRRSQAYLAEAQRLSATGNFGWHVVDGAHVWSDETYRIFGHDRTMPITHQVLIDRAHPDDRDAVRQLIADAEEGLDIDREYRLQMDDGSVKFVHLVAHGIDDRDGARSVVGALREVTAQRRSEEAIRSLRSALAHATRVGSIGALTAAIAHEVSQPLSGVVTNASICVRMLAAQPLDLESVRETAQRTSRDAIRASEVIARLRALLSGTPPSLEPVDLNEAAREVIALASSEWQTGRTVTRSELADDLPTVSADRIQLQQVIINLLRNAHDALRDVEDRDREIVIRTSRDENGSLRFSVSDSGIGIEAHDGERLYDAFYTTKPDGMGVGLCVSRTIVESHGGRLWMVPNEPHGVTFAFSLPCCAERGTAAI